MYKNETTIRNEEANIPRPYNLLRHERSKIDFSVDGLFQFFEGNDPKMAERSARISRLLERDLVLHHPPDYYENGDSKTVRKSTFLKVKQIALYAEKILQDQLDAGVPFDKLDITDVNLIMSLYHVYDPQSCTRFGIHFGLFFAAIRGNGTLEQVKYWGYEKGGLFARNIYGCFGMTELAHGSNVAGLETTAEYDFATKTFTLNTPHIGATKWWIGGAGQTSNHCVVYARMIVKGKDYGVKTFVAPIRDENHHLFPGVAVGDIGAKMGRDGIDNGWIQFTDYKIPKNFLLQKYVQIDDETQEVSNSPMDQLAYGALIGGRINMVKDLARVGAKVTTTALRYAIGRRQFGKTENLEANFALPKEIDESLRLEKQLIDYPNHQYRLVPLLATSYCIAAAGHRIDKEYFRVLARLDSPDLLTNQKTLFSTLGALKQLFVQSASVKALATWFGSRAIDECRQSCGGHGYSAYAGFGKLYNDWVVQCTWEGDNNVLSMNSGRSMVKYRQSALAGKLVPPEFSFFKKKFGSFRGSWSDLKAILELFEALQAKKADSIISKLQGGTPIETVTSNLIELAKINYARYVLESALLSFNSEKTVEESKDVLSKVINLFALYNVKESAAFFLATGVLKGSDIEAVEQEIFGTLLPYLRPKIAGLVDGFKLSDFYVNLPLGTYDGDIYNRFFDAINAVNNNRADYDKCDYQDDILAVLKRGTIEQREQFVKSKEVLEKLGR